MANASAADKMRPALQIFAKYHFWMLAVIVPCVVVPVLVMAQTQILGQIGVVKGQIESCISSLKTIRNISRHDNPAWAEPIDKSVLRVKRETLAEWQRFWDSQASLRVWPDALGVDFVKAVKGLKPDGKLSLKLLERYQDVVRSLVRELPGRMGAEELMQAGDGSGMGGEGRPRPMSAIGPGGDLSPPGSRPGLFQPGGPGSQPGAAGGEPLASPYNVVWNQANQQQLFKWFDWDKPPTTTMVVMAQEELRVYGVLCDLIARMNKPATGPHNAAISVVNELLVGYPAATDIAGGATRGRIRSASPQAAGGMMMSGMDASGGAEGGGGGGKPAHPRFGAGSSAMGSGMADPSMADAPAAPADAGPTDDSLRTWVYVDFNDKPLEGAQLSSAPEATMVHLMPFVMKLVMDQRQLDALLVEMATGPLPIDVRQVRINAAGGAGDAGAMMSSSGPGEGMSGMSGMSGGGTPAASRVYDVPVEIHGTIGLATQPNEAAVGLEPGQATEKPANGDKAAAIVIPPGTPVAPGHRAPPAAGRLVGQSVVVHMTVDRMAVRHDSFQPRALRGPAPLPLRRRMTS